MAGYIPGLQPSAGQRIVKLNTNENPYPPSPLVLEALRKASDQAVRLYPSPLADNLREQAASTYGIRAEQVLCGNGSDEILAIVMRAFVDQGDSIACLSPSYSLYPVLASIAGARVITAAMPRCTRAGQAGEIPIPVPEAKVFFLSTPNSPYATGFPTSWIARLLEEFSGIVVADEAYVDFAVESCVPLLATNPRLIVVRTLSKAYSLAGMRAGLAFAHPAIVAEMMKVKDSYNLGRHAQAAACAALADQEYFRSTRDAVKATRAAFTARLSGMGFAVLPSQANFVFAVPPAPAPVAAAAGGSAKPLYEALLARGFLVRWFAVPELSDGLRISIGTDEQMDGLAKAIAEVMHGGQ
jgi:histidinol-phosphate aminotransferase